MDSYKPNYKTFHCQYTVLIVAYQCGHRLHSRRSFIVEMHSNAPLQRMNRKYTIDEVAVEMAKQNFMTDFKSITELFRVPSTERTRRHRVTENNVIVYTSKNRLNRNDNEKLRMITINLQQQRDLFFFSHPHQTINLLINNNFHSRIIIK